MGEIADDFINGACCSECSAYFVPPKDKIQDEDLNDGEHDYPVLCKECWKEKIRDGDIKPNQKITKEGLQEAILDI